MHNCIFRPNYCCSEPKCPIQNWWNLASRNLYIHRSWCCSCLCLVATREWQTSYQFGYGVDSRSPYSVGARCETGQVVGDHSSHHLFTAAFERPLSINSHQLLTPIFCIIHLVYCYFHPRFLDALPFEFVLLPINVETHDSNLSIWHRKSRVPQFHSLHRMLNVRSNHCSSYMYTIFSPLCRLTHKKCLLRLAYITVFILLYIHETTTNRRHKQSHSPPDTYMLVPEDWGQEKTMPIRIGGSADRRWFQTLGLRPMC